MKQFALITGASKGIGLAFAEILARQGNNLFLVARDEKNLVFLKKRLENDFSVEVIIFPADLSVPELLPDLFNFIRGNNIEINILINNAALGYCGRYFDLEWEEEMRMVNLNIVSHICITKYFLNKMLKTNFGVIINVISTVAFVPGPYSVSYSASKAYLLSYTESLAEEIRGSQIRLMALCPGPTRTEFHRKSGLPVSESELKHMPGAEQVAKYCWDFIKKKKVVIIYGWKNKILVFLARIMPVCFLGMAIGNLKRKKLRYRKICL